MRVLSMPSRAARHLVTLTSVAVAACVAVAAPASAVVTGPVFAAVTTFPIVQGSSGPIGDVTLTEAAPGQFQVGDQLTFRFADSGSFGTLHFATPGTVSGTNGLAGSVVVASSSATLNDEMKVTITAASSGSFPGVLTLAGLTAAVDNTAALGNDKVTVTDSNVLTPAALPAIVADANVINTTSRALYAAQSAPTILSTGTNQNIGSVTITEPAKGFFQTNDVVTFSLRDANGTSDTVGLATAPLAAGGSMTVAVAGANGPSVQVNDAAFNVKIVAKDPASGSSSTLTVSNIVVNTAQAPIGPVTLSAVVTTGAGTEYIVPGRVTVANVGGNTNTTAAGTPALAASTPGEVAANVAISVAAGSLLHGDTISLQLQTPGVTFTASNALQATVTSGSLILSSATAALDGTDTTATWTVGTGNLSSSTVVIGPILYDVGAVPAGTSVQLLASGEQGSAFTSQVVTDAVIAPVLSYGTFAAAQPLPSINTPPYSGSNITFTETAAGSTPAGSNLVLVSPYATQIAAYRTTFTAVPAAASSGNGLTLGAPTVNSSAVVVSTPNGNITAPAQTVLTIPVLTASTTGPATVTVSGLTFNLGAYVPPGALVVSGVVQPSVGNVGGNEVTDIVNTHNLGTSSATTPPNIMLTQTPPAASSLDYGTFAFSSDQPATTYACALDAQVISLNCPTPITLPGLSEGSHTFSVQGFNSTGYSSAVVSYTWTVDTTPPTATIVHPTTVTAPLVVTFSKPALELSPSTVTLGTVAAGSSTPTPLTVALTCVSGGAAPVACDPSTAYDQVRVQPSAPLVPGEHYVLTLDPVGVVPAIADAAGNPLATVSDAFRGPQTVQENAAGAVAAWRNVSDANASGKSYAVARLAGATASFTFTGTSVSWQTVTGPTQGQAYVYVDNVKKASPNNYTNSVHYGVLRTVSGLSAGTHTLKILVRGVKGNTAAKDTQIAVDAFVVGGTRSQQSAAVVTWRGVAATSASGHSYAVDNLAGAAYSMTFRGTGVTWWTVLGPAMGKASVYVDHVLKGTYSTYASSTKYGKAIAIGGLADGVHLVQVVVLGTRVAAATGTNVAVDRFTVA